MGAGAFLTVYNRQSYPVTIGVSDITSIKDSGSNLWVFNNLVLVPGAAFPTGRGQYIETDGGSGSFKMSFSGNSQSSSITISAAHSNYNSTSANNVYPSIDNSGPQAVIDVKLASI